MRRRFENIKTVAGGKIPVFACSISAPTTTWRNPVPILGLIIYYNNPQPYTYCMAGDYCSYHLLL